MAVNVKRRASDHQARIVSPSTTLSYTFCWMRARTSSASSRTRARSSAAAAPWWATGIGSAPQIGLDDVDALGDVRIDRARVDADDALDPGVGGKQAREPGAQRVGHAGDEDAPA